MVDGRVPITVNTNDDDNHQSKIVLSGSPVVVVSRWNYTRLFLDASSYLYKMVCPSVGRLVHRSVGPSVGRCWLGAHDLW